MMMMMKTLSVLLAAINGITAPSSPIQGLPVTITQQPSDERHSAGACTTPHAVAA
jgi:hypothetical protein